MNMKKALIALLLVALAAGAIFGGRLLRLLPLVTTSNDGAEQVVLLHGLGRSERAMLLLEGTLTEAGFDVHSIGYPSREQPPEVLLGLVTHRISACCRTDAPKVHFVGHSLGGLLIRAYLASHRPLNLGRVVLLGAPNSGSELADADLLGPFERALLDRAGPSARAMQPGPDGFPATLPPPDYPVGVIAGTRGSALSDAWLPVPNDGMVSVESARLEGMTDFMTFDVAHWDLRNDPDVAAQVVGFLRDGHFTRDPASGP